MEKVFGILVTYNPDIQNLNTNIISILKQVDRLFIFDNNSANKKEIEDIIEAKQCVAYYSDKNVGLGKAYNYWLNLYAERFQYFVTFDQDTLIPVNAISILSSVLDKNENIGIIGPVFSIGTGNADESGRVIDSFTIIQSCAIFRSELYKVVGGFNEDYFIDSVDFEYCLRTAKAGYRAVRYNGVTIQHTLGLEKRSLGIKYYSHTGIRNYYIARNHRQITIDFFKDFPVFIIKKNIFFLIHVLKIILLERDLKKLKCLLNGLMNRNYE